MQRIAYQLVSGRRFHPGACKSGLWLVFRLALALLAGAGLNLGQPAAVPSAPVTRPPLQPGTPSVARAAETAPAPFTPSVYKTFAEWRTACEPLPSNRTLKMTLPPAELLPLKKFGEFMEVLDAFFRLAKTNELAQDNAWLGQPPVKPAFFNTDATYFLRPTLPFQPFVQRALVPAGSQIFFHGDLHGDIRSLVAWVDWLNRNGYLRDFHLARPDVYLVFLGDYTDRGMYGVEVLYTLLRLKVENPDRVFLVRGNHEDVGLASRYGFIGEGRGKYGTSFDGKRVMRLYDFLPVVLYLGTENNVLQCNHGGMEPGFDPRPLLDAPDPVRFQLLGKLNQQQFLKSHPEFSQGASGQARRLMDNTLVDFQPETPTSPVVIGFMWNDFSVVRGEPQFDFDPGRAFIYGENPTKVILRQSSTAARQVQAVFRAHQHATILNGMMRRLKVGRGVYRHWQENDSVSLLQADLAVVAQKIEVSEERRVPPLSVFTFNVLPDIVYGEALVYSFDTFGILTTAKSFEDWRLRVVNQTIRK
jgi:hypothetical protein